MKKTGSPAIGVVFNSHSTEQGTAELMKPIQGNAATGIIGFYTDAVPVGKHGGYQGGSRPAERIQDRIAGKGEHPYEPLCDFHRIAVLRV